MFTEEEVKQLAYTIWEQEGRPLGQDTRHYFTAERILETWENWTLWLQDKKLLANEWVINLLRNCGDVSQDEFLQFGLGCLEKLQREKAPNEKKGATERALATTDREESVYVTRREFQQFKHRIGDFITTYLHFIIVYFYFEYQQESATQQ